MKKSAAEILYYHFELTFLDRGREGSNQELQEVKDVIYGGNLEQFLSCFDIYWCFNPESTIFAQINQQFK